MYHVPSGYSRRCCTRGRCEKPEFGLPLVQTRADLKDMKIRPDGLAKTPGNARVFCIFTLILNFCTSKEYFFT